MSAPKQRRIQRLHSALGRILLSDLDTISAADIGVLRKARIICERHVNASGSLDEYTTARENCSPLIKGVS